MANGKTHQKLQFLNDGGTASYSERAAEGASTNHTPQKYHQSLI
jgi:hypothetical protein